MIDVKKMRELAKETRHMAYVASEIGHTGAAEQFFECADAILALCDRLEAMEREREDQNRYLAAQSAEIAGLKQRLAQQPSGEVTDIELLNAMAPHLNDADGGYILDYAAQSVVAAVRAAIAINAARTQGGES
ncbi:hypothetical protein [Burkholderia pseudomallei]|uniref:hypothetical protein n=1 Tax=Burkholderia pseudomallei TaxID=28450 RepID=UPI00053924E5|nr:hypothetical protein [Burkholderia pseudomallei]KGX47223.1 hypothetical protein Y043_5627 [Burkholderia pseudomallei MSHR2138]KGX48415.1 hypothetical protein Y600_6283 [Burkholderia pseudomallei MSHR3709]